MEPQSLEKYGDRMNCLYQSMVTYVCDKRIRDTNMGDFYNKNNDLVVALPRELYGHAFLERMLIRACLYAKRVVSWEKYYDEMFAPTPETDNDHEQEGDQINTQELYQEMDRLDDDIRFQRRELGIIKHTPDSFDNVPQQDLGQSSQKQAAVNYSQGQQHELGSTTDSQRLAPGVPQRRAITSSLRYQALSQSYNFSSTTQSQQGRNLQHHTSPARFQQQDLPTRPQSVSVSNSRYDMYDESDSQRATSDEEFNDVQEDKLLDELETKIERLFDQQEEEEQKLARENPEADVYSKSKRKKFEEE